MAGSEEENGGFLHVSGLTYQIDPTIPSTVQSDAYETWVGGPTGEYRVHNVKIYNKDTDTWDALNLNANYNLAGHNYTLRELGGGYAMFDGAVNVLDYVMEDYMVLANYVQGFENAFVDAANSPLTAKYPAFKVDYGSVNGSGRIILSEKDENTASEDSTASSTFASSHLVLQGDTLWALSKKYNCTVKEFMACNAGLIRNPDLILVGWELVIPRR